MVLFFLFVCRLIVDSGRVNDFDGFLIGVSVGEGKSELLFVMDRFFLEEIRGDIGRINGRDLFFFCSF